MPPRAFMKIHNVLKMQYYMLILEYNISKTMYNVSKMQYYLTHYCQNT